MFMTISFFEPDLGRPDLASLLGKTGGDAKTHRCLGDFLIFCGFPAGQLPESLWFQEDPFRLASQIDHRAQAGLRMGP
jgi:hypothetical protein